MHVPQWFAKELSLINPKYFAHYDERSRTWRISKWISNFPRKHTIDIDSEPVCIVKYPVLDVRMLDTIRRGLYWARKAKDLLQKVDEDNAREIEQADNETEYISRYMAKDIYRHYREPRVIGGVTGTDRKWKY